MKKRILVLVSLVILLFGGVAFGQTWHTANQITIGWDAVTELTNDTPLPATDIVKYKVFIKNAATGGELVELGEVTTLEYVVTLNVEGSYFLGVSAVRYSGENVFLGESIVCWSDIATCCENAEAFGVRYFVPPVFPGGLKKK